MIEISDDDVHLVAPVVQEIVIDVEVESGPEIGGGAAEVIAPVGLRADIEHVGGLIDGVHHPLTLGVSVGQGLYLRGEMPAIIVNVGTPGIFFPGAAEGYPYVGRVPCIPARIAIEEMPYIGISHVARKSLAVVERQHIISALVQGVEHGPSREGFSLDGDAPRVVIAVVEFKTDGHAILVDDQRRPLGDIGGVGGLRIVVEAGLGDKSPIANVIAAAAISVIIAAQRCQLQPHALLHGMAHYVAVIDLGVG